MRNDDQSDPIGQFCPEPTDWPSRTTEFHVSEVLAGLGAGRRSASTNAT